MNKKEPLQHTLVDKAMLEIHQRIASRRLLPGGKLPSIRKFSEIMQVSKSTVVDAYDRLAAEGIIQSKKGSGFFVSGPLSPLNLGALEGRQERELNPLWVSRQSLETGDDYLKPGCGWLPASWMPQAIIRRALRDLSRAEDCVLSDYGTPLGHFPLRQLLSRRMEKQDIIVPVDQIILMESGTQAIDLLCRFFIKPGDKVMVDDPCYFNFRALLKAHQAEIVSVPYTKNGPDLDVFEQVLVEHQPRLYITNSTLHNPTGASLSMKTAHKLLKICAQSNVTIIEDDIFADFEVTVSPRLVALDGLDQVIHIGSFSKTLSASARCGFIAARKDWIEGLVDLKIATSFGGGAFSADLTWRVLKNGAYRKYIDGLHIRLARAMDETIAKLKEIGLKPWLIPNAGMYVWAQLPDGCDAGDVARLALTHHIILAPGNVFSLSGNASSFLRFNVSQCQNPIIFEVLEQIIIQHDK
jgi:DNA-binding transcriptional MocR family regulator